MKQEELENVESRLGITLPGRYRTALLEGVEVDGISLEPYFDQDPRSLLTSNQELRLSGQELDGKLWPSGRFRIGDDGCGNFYYLDVDDPTCAVGFYDHETDDLELYAVSLESYLKKIAKLMRGIG